MTNLSQLIVYIHENYLRRICAESEFIGLKYHGGPAAKCQCKEGGLGVLHYVSFCMESKASEEPKLILDCEHCLTSQNIEQLLQLQVSFWYLFSYASDISSIIIILQVKDRNAYPCVKEIQSVMMCIILIFYNIIVPFSLYAAFNLIVRGWKSTASIR